jgi:hypothetical protein
MVHASEDKSIVEALGLIVCQQVSLLRILVVRYQRGFRSRCLTSDSAASKSKMWYLMSLFEKPQIFREEGGVECISII